MGGKIKVATASFASFHMYDQAYQLQKHGILDYIVTNYPKSITGKYGIDDKHVISTLYTGITHRIVSKIYNVVGMRMPSVLTRMLHDQFSRSVPRLTKAGVEVFIGLSSYSLEALKFFKKNHVLTIVDHGSVHLRYDNKLLKNVYSAFNLKSEKLIDSWIIEKEDQEFETADYILLGSNFAKDTFISEGFSSDKLLVNNYGVDLKMFSQQEKNDAKFRIIFCGGISIRKGVHIILKAFHELNLKDSELWLVGSMPSKNDIEKTINKIGFSIDNSKVFFKGPYPQTELPKIYSQGTLFILPSLSDGFGMVVPQALACGLPSIVTENVGAKDVVKNYYNGFVVTNNDFKEIIEKIKYLYNNPSKCEQMSRNAIESVQHGLSWDDYGDRLVKQLTDIKRKENNASTR